MRAGQEAVHLLVLGLEVGDDQAAPNERADGEQSPPSAALENA
jgi:hypothetical protein